MFEPKTMLYFWIFIIVIGFILYLMNCRVSGNKEGFYIGRYPYRRRHPYKRYCSNCSHKSRRGCAICTNCGVGVTQDGHEGCLPGDSFGSYYRNDVLYWKYGSSYRPYNAIEPVIRMYSKRPLRKYKRRKMTGWKWWEKRKPGEQRWRARDKFITDENLFRYGWKSN